MSKCGKCSKSSCGGGCDEKSVSNMQNDLDTLKNAVDDLIDLTKFLKGHPIWPIDDPSDIVLFDLATGKGSGIWGGWGICNDTNYPGLTGNIATPDLRDRFIVGSGATYAVGDTGGANTVTLVTAEIPAHNHGITDPGHTHVITDPGHDHNVTDPGHTHGGSSAAHIHTFTTDPAGAHSHNYDKFDPGGSGYDLAITTPPYQATLGTTTQATTAVGNHEHEGVTDPTATIVTIAAAFTGIDMDDAFTGITINSAVTGISTTNTGGGTAHENRPPYWALLWIKKIF